MGREEIDEDVTVGAVFRGGRLVPKWFLWGGSRRSVERVNMVWKDRQGEARLRLFSVSSGGNSYELILNQTTLEWRLRTVSWQ